MQKISKFHEAAIKFQIKVDFYSRSLQEEREQCRVRNIQSAQSLAHKSSRDFPVHVEATSPTISHESTRSYVHAIILLSCSDTEAPVEKK